mmetsp:Transcript_14922/g.29959  ORF Transcript_14922/g.29959 Transcript_14922/m.29959 type:complete len:686 (+) Transcript_14922:210-2267(+)
MSSWSPPAGSAAWKSYISTSVSSAVSGAGAVATEMLGAVSSSVPRETSLSQWMPPSVQAYLPGRDPSKTAGSDRDKVVSVTFDVDIGSPAHPQFLCMCFRNGFQVWEVQDTAEGSTQANRETQPLREVLSVRQGYTRLVKCLPSVPVPEGSLLSGQQPVLGVVSGDEVGDLNMLKIFSLKSNRYIHQLKFHGDVLGVVCNRKWLVVVLKNQLLVYSLEHLALQHTLNTFPNQTPTGVVALGARWLAYASNQPLLSHGEAPTMTYGSPLFDVGVGVAGTMASGAKQLGEMGLRTLNSYLSSSPTLSEPVPAEPALEYAGSVMIRDMDTQQVLHHFRAHDAPLGIMKFDPSGLLLVTAAVDGRNINLFEINSHAGKGGRSAPKHLYKLVRGVTSSAIQDIAFSIDTRWVAVTSNRGTAHLYPINPDGSPASVDTHVPSPAANAAWPIYPLSASYAAVPSPPITVFAVARIRTCDGGAAAAAAAAGGIPTSSSKLNGGSSSSFPRVPAALIRASTLTPAPSRSSSNSIIDDAASPGDAFSLGEPASRPARAPSLSLPGPWPTSGPMPPSSSQSSRSRRPPSPDAGDPKMSSFHAALFVALLLTELLDDVMMSMLRLLESEGSGSELFAAPAGSRPGDTVMALIIIAALLAAPAPAPRLPAAAAADDDDVDAAAAAAAVAAAAAAGMPP